MWDPAIALRAFCWAYLIDLVVFGGVVSLAMLFLVGWVILSERVPGCGKKATISIDPSATRMRESRT